MMMLIYLSVPVLAFLAGMLVHWRLTRKQRQDLAAYRRSARAEYQYAPGRRR
jgi:uncharacterized membrane protein affecting hemolysin expression